MLNTDWLLHSIRWKLRRAGGGKAAVNKYYNKEILGRPEVNLAIREFILSGRPFMAGRLGNTELQTMVAYQKECKNFFYKRKMNKKIANNAGFFPASSSHIIKFVELMQESMAYVDLLGVWNNYMEDYMVNRYCSENCILGRLAGLEPWYAENEPWSELLEGKKIVFVHPFEATIMQQWKKRNEIFASSRILPQFDLRIVKAVQTLAGNTDSRFGSWFEALDYMYEQVFCEEFDIAIIGCGAYGFPLAAKVKKTGKSAIHLGGATQLFFGIRGKRWEQHPVISNLFNEYWTNPLPEDVPDNCNRVEKGCYW